MPESMRANILRTLRDSQRRSLSRVAVKRWALGFAAAAVVLFGVFAAEWLNLRHGGQLIASILKLGVSDHVICAIKGHNYPEVANPPDEIREKLGARYAPLLQVVQQRLPGLKLLEGHICSIPGSDRKYVHFITRGHGTILSVILTERKWRSPSERQTPLQYGLRRPWYLPGHLSGMEIAGFESGNTSPSLSRSESKGSCWQLARGLAPALNETLHTTARLLRPNATTQWAKHG